MNIQVVITGRGYDAAANVPERLTLPDGCGLDEALRTVAAMMPGEKGLPESCLVAVGGNHLGTVSSHGPCVLRDGDELMIIAPVAGG